MRHSKRWRALGDSAVHPVIVALGDELGKQALRGLDPSLGDAALPRAVIVAIRWSIGRK